MFFLIVAKHCRDFQFSWNINFWGNLPRDIFQEAVSLNRSNHSAVVQTFKLNQNTFNITSTKIFNLVKIIQYSLTLFGMGFFGAAHGWGEGKKAPPS